MHISAPLRRQVIESAAERDPFECPFCHFVFIFGVDDPNINVDHKVPLAMGGTTTLENLQVTCRSCNKSKSIAAQPVDNREGVSRIVICSCEKRFSLHHNDYIACLTLIRARLLPCSECREAIAPAPKPPPKRKKSVPGAGLPEGFEPAKATFKKEGLP
jgi:hypothetical protein